MTHTTPLGTHHFALLHTVDEDRTSHAGVIYGTPYVGQDLVHWVMTRR